MRSRRFDGARRSSRPGRFERGHPPVPGDFDGVIASYGGYVAKFLGDGLLAYFGYPAAHEDEAENAVRAGLDLVAKVRRLLLPSGEALKVRVGVATGLVVVGNIATGSTKEVAATGETPNLAARLQELAAPNTVVVSEVTRRLLGGGFVCERLAPHKAKGFSEPVNAFVDHWREGRREPV